MIPQKMKQGRLDREKRIVRLMVRLYCDHHHTEETPCKDCEDLIQYAIERLNHCPFGENKPTCSHCHIHCYKKDMRERIRMVMRYSGLRMVWRHPLYSLRHLIDRVFCSY